MLTGTDSLWWLWLGFFREHLAAFVSLLVLLPLSLILNWRLALLLIALCVVFAGLTALVLRKAEAGQSAVELFEAGQLDYTSIFETDATWVAYDPTLGAQLREVPALSTDYYGFDTTRPPFDDVRVRRMRGDDEIDRLLGLFRLRRLTHQAGDNTVDRDLVFRQGVDMRRWHVLAALAEQLVDPVLRHTVHANRRPGRGIA
jgi:hypothetical protein